MSPYQVGAIQSFGFKSKDGLLKITPSNQYGKWYCFLIEKSTKTEIYSQNPVEWDTVLSFMDEYGYGRRDIWPMEYKPMSDPNDKCEHRARETNLYVIQAVSGGPIKIGVADNVPSRLAQLQTGNPNELTVIKVMHNIDPQIEHKLHKKYSKQRIIGEWFDESILPLILQGGTE